MAFSDLFGLDAPVQALRRALQGDALAGAYLLVGPHGVGKTALARAFARAAACPRPVASPFEACGACESCRRAEAGEHPEIVLVPPAGEQTQIWQFWDRDGKPAGVLQRSLPFAPSIGRRRVYIVERAETLTEPAANSLLKVLEEPPAYVVFVLLAPQAAQLLGTIVSRCQVVRLTSSPADPLARWLREARAVPQADAAVCAAYAEGRTGTALRLATDPRAAAEFEEIAAFAESLPGALPLSAPRTAERIRRLAGSVKALGADDPGYPSDNGGRDASLATDEAPAARERVGRRQLAVVIELLALFYRDLLALRLDPPGARIVRDDRRGRLAGLAAAGSPERWTGCLQALMAARRRLDMNASVALLTDWLAVRLLVDA